MITPRRETIFRLLSIVIGLLLPLVVVEAGLRLLPVKNGPWQAETTAEQPVARFHPGQSFTWSVHAYLAHPRRGQVNTAGFLNQNTYDPAGTTPLLAVIGDSFVESLQVPLAATFYSRLQNGLGDGGRVYSFGISGAPLSQYLVWADHARAVYKPSLMAVSIVSNDFDESLLAYKLESDPGAARSFHYFVPERDSFRLHLVENHPSLLASLARQSSLIRYLYLNCSLRFDESLLVRLGLRRSPVAAPQGVSARELELRRMFPVAEFEPLAERQALSRRAIDHFLAELPGRAGLPASRIILTVDAERVAMLAPELAAKTRASFYRAMRSHLIAQATAAGFVVVDLEAPMRAFVKATGTPIELADDYHWNADGHRVVADAIAATDAFKAVFPSMRTAARPASTVKAP